MPRYAIIGVEGPHDQAFVAKVLQTRWGFTKFRGKRDELDRFWVAFIPNYPRNGDLYKRLDMPSVLAKGDDLSVAVYAGEGSNLRSNLSDILTNRPEYCEQVSAFGLVVDSDKEPPSTVAKGYARAFRGLFPSLPDAPGQVDLGSPRTGVFVLPDNCSQGVLDSLLVACGRQAYPKHMNAADAYLGQFSGQDTAHWEPYSREKAHIATVVSVLKPGKTNTVSLADDDWVSPPTFAALAEFIAFAGNLLDLP
jgi:hypothetical protein